MMAYGKHNPSNLDIIGGEAKPANPPANTRALNDPVDAGGRPMLDKGTSPYAGVTKAPKRAK